MRGHESRVTVLYELGRSLVTGRGHAALPSNDISTVGDATVTSVQAIAALATLRSTVASSRAGSVGLQRFGRLN